MGLTSVRMAQRADAAITAGGFRSIPRGIKKRGEIAAAADPGTKVNPDRSLRASAERVLFGGALEDKLRPICLDDSAPGRPIDVPAAPGRPPGLEPSTARSAFPRSFADPSARARMLHFLANHELLAIELLALALLRFPDAEPGWRRGLGAILGQEQDHLAGYLGRLEAAGLEFGEQPLNRYFWSALAGARSPAEFTAGLSLTFEQANLDHASHFAAEFRAVGDVEGALLLDRVLADEIEHVSHGVRWLQAWCPGVDLWTAWTGLLEPPLTPARAKGAHVVIGPRLAAGIPVEVIDRLRVYSASKGRLPVVGWFVPDVEGEVGAEGWDGSAAGGPCARSARRGRATASVVAGDLATLPMFLLGADDHVLAPVPGERWLAGVQAAGFTVPGFDLSPPARPERWLPWGQSPAVCAVTGSSWDPRWRDLYSKAWLQEHYGEGSVAHTMDDVERLGGVGFVLKAPFSTAGRGLKRWERNDRDGWAKRVLAEQGAVVVEPWEERVMDLSVQFDVGPGKVHPWGRFLVDPHGRYRAARIGRPLEGLSRDLLRWLHGHDVQAAMEAAIKPVAAEMAKRGFAGPAGVDAYISTVVGPDGSSTFRLRPLVELNPRITMGRVAMHVARRVRRDRAAVMRVVTAGQLLGAGTTPEEWTARMVSLPAPAMRDGLIDDGSLMLTEPRPERRLWVVLDVGGACQDTGC